MHNIQLNVKIINNILHDRILILNSKIANFFIDLSDRENIKPLTTQLISQVFSDLKLKECVVGCDFIQVTILSLDPSVRYHEVINFIESDGALVIMKE